MSLKTRLMDDVKAAMKGGDKERLQTLRLITSAIKQVEIDTRSEGERLELDDAQVLSVLEKMLKQAVVRERPPSGPVESPIDGPTGANY